jgi:hypothetical protein
MRISLFILFSCLAIFCFLDSYGQHNGRHLRTDGFYVYDNGLDTIVTIPGGEEMQLEMLTEMTKKGFIKPDTHFSHIDSIAKLSDGSTDVSFIVFFCDTSGTAFGTIYRDSILKRFFNTVNERRAGRDDRRFGIISNIVFQDDSTFTFVVGDPFVPKVFNCSIKPYGLHVSIANDIEGPFRAKVYDYNFIPFDNIPPDLFVIKK